MIYGKNLGPVRLIIKTFLYKPFAKQDQTTQSTVNVLITFVVSTGEKSEV